MMIVSFQFEKHHCDKKYSEEHIMGERLDDGHIYVRRRVNRSPNR